MDNTIIVPLIKILQNLPVEITSIILLIICIISILTLFKLFGAQGLYLHSIVAILAANIQILKVIQFDCYNSPIALGTIVFASTYLCSGILTEHFGELAAKKNIWYSFFAQILMTLLMLITIGHKPWFFNHQNSFLAGQSTLAGQAILSEQALLAGQSILEEQALLVEQALHTLFTPLPRILFASLISFIISQYSGIFVFNLVKKITLKRYIWLRAIALLIFSTTIDTFIFNLLAWKLLSPTPLDFTIILHTYIIFTLITQWCIAILSTPVIYFSYFFKPYNSY